jgi:hypothetical protein
LVIHDLIVQAGKRAKSKGGERKIFTGTFKEIGEMRSWEMIGKMREIFQKRRGKRFGIT